MSALDTTIPFYPNGRKQFYDLTDRWFEPHTGQVSSTELFDDLSDDELDLLMRAASIPEQCFIAYRADVPDRALQYGILVESDEYVDNESEDNPEDVCDAWGVDDASEITPQRVVEILRERFSELADITDAECWLDSGERIFNGRTVGQAFVSLQTLQQEGPEGSTMKRATRAMFTEQEFVARYGHASAENDEVNAKSDRPRASKQNTAPGM